MPLDGGHMTNYLGVCLSLTLISWKLLRMFIFKTESRAVVGKRGGDQDQRVWIRWPKCKQKQIILF